MPQSRILCVILYFLSSTGGIAIATAEVRMNQEFMQENLKESASWDVVDRMGFVNNFTRRKNSYWRRESRKFKEPIEKLLRPENIIIRQSNACDTKNTEAVTVLGHALMECGIENEIATYMKKKFDEKFGVGWQCVVGRNFGSHIDCVEFVHLNVSKISVLIFRCR